MNINPTRTIDLASALGSGASFFELCRYDGLNAVRFALATGGVEGEGLTVPLAALPSLAALVGGAQTFLSAPVDLTGTPSGIQLVPSAPGCFFLPANNDPLMIVNLSSAGAMTTTPKIRYGNPSSSGNMGGGSGGAPVDVGTFGQPAKTIRSSFVTGPATLADLSTAINVDVVQAGAGTGGFAWSVRFVLTGWIVPAF
ncbi:MAG TPA: hypothetical protein VHO67_04730 [Polyangia bacterium]|nr:hypothetical protein [Polyangia bacterium]